MSDIKIIKLDTHAQGLIGWIAVQNDHTLGHIFMSVELEMKIKFLDAWVHEEHRRKGIFRKLWNTRWLFVQENYIGYKVYAWALPKSLPLLLEKGFIEGDTCVYVERQVEDLRPPGEQCFVSC
tara:strand:+ start:1071 stop:1439 length:369 start_codon:yes stop_codon:yes gene_type:complete